MFIFVVNSDYLFLWQPCAISFSEIHNTLSHLFVTRSLLLVPTSNMRYLYEVVGNLVVLNRVLFDLFGYLPMSLCDWCK